MESQSLQQEQKSQMIMNFENIWKLQELFYGMVMDSVTIITGIHNMIENLKKNPQQWYKVNKLEYIKCQE